MNRKSLILAGLITALALCASSAYSQPNLRWLYTYGTEANDVARNVAITPNNELMIAGWTGVKGAGIPIMLRLDDNGDSLWLQSYGSDRFDCPNTIIACPDGGYAFGGASFNQEWDRSKYYYGRIAEDGALIWERYYGASDQAGSGNVLLRGEAGDFYVAGTSNLIIPNDLNVTDMCLTKVSADGDSLWSKCVGDAGIDYCNAAIETSDGRFILAGNYTNGREDDDPMTTMAMVDAEGDSIWMRTWWSETASGANDVVELPDGNFLAATYLWVEGHPSVVLMWVTPEGDHVNTATHESELACFPTRIFLLDNGDILICGMNKVADGVNWDFWFARFTPDGTLRWEQSYGGDLTDFLRGAALTPDRGVVAVGESGLYANGNMDNSSMMVLRTATLPLYISQPLNPAAPSAFSIASIYPNPFNSVASAICQLPSNASARASLTDLQGRLIRQWTMQGSASGESRTIIDGANLPAGQYRFMLNRDGRVAEAPVVIVK